MEISGLAVRQAARALMRAASGDPVPLHASLELTLRCNGDCPYCGSSRAASSLGDLPTSFWNDVIDDLARSGCLAVSLTGGEPLLRTDVEAIACRARRRGLFVGLNTNGALLEKRRSILQYVSSINVSIDGVETVNDAIRGPGSFAAAVAAVRSARHTGVKVGVTTVLSADAVDGLAEFLVWLKSMDLAASFQPMYGNRLRSGDVPGCRAPGPEKLARAFAMIRAAIPDGVVRNSPDGLEMLALSVGQDSVVSCLGGRFFVRVAAGGAVEVCGLSGDPCRRPGMEKNLDARDGIVFCMKQLGWPFSCPCCQSAARVEVNRLLAAPVRGRGTDIR